MANRTLPFSTAALAVLIAPVVPPLSAADAFEIDDVVISNPDIPIADPEFDSADSRIVWQDGPGNVWVADVDTATGLLSPLSGMGTLVASSAAPLVKTLNGPEWAFGSDGSFVLYTQYVGDRLWLAAATETVPGQWTSSLLGDGLDRFSPVGSPPGTDGPARAVYNAALGETFVQEYRDVLHRQSRELVRLPVSRGGRWVEGRDLIVTSALVNGVRQIIVQDVTTGERTPVSSGSTQDKVLPFGWYAPELGTTLISAKLGARRVIIYRETDGGWEPWYLFSLPSSRPYVHSPEPFVYEGKSYLAVVAADDDAGPGGQPSGPTDIWIAGIDPEAPFFRQVSTTEQEGNRTDPEPFVLDSGPVIYYTQYLSGPNTFLLRKAATGL